MRVLVAYSSLHGDTRGLAAHIAATLQRRGLQVTVAHADAADRIGRYDAFVIGGAAWRSHWLNEAARFVRLHWMLLVDRPVWLFSAGQVEARSVAGGDRPPGHALAPREFAEFAGTINPRGSRVFAGGIDDCRAQVGLAGRLRARVSTVIPSMRPARRAALADQPAIEVWAEAIARELALIGG